MTKKLEKELEELTMRNDNLDRILESVKRGRERADAAFKQWEEEAKQEEQKNKGEK